MNLGRRANFSKKFTLPLRRFSGLCHVVHISRRRGNMATRDRSLKLFNAILGGGGYCKPASQSGHRATISELAPLQPEAPPPPAPPPLHSQSFPSQSVCPSGSGGVRAPSHPRAHTRTLTQVRGQADRVVLHPERSGHWDMKWSRGSVTWHRALGRCI